MVNNFIRLKQRTNNKILDHASIDAAQINARWTQTLYKLLKTNGFAYVLFNPQYLNRDQLLKQFLQRYKNNYLQSFYYSDSNRIDNYLPLKENSDNQPVNGGGGGEWEREREKGKEEGRRACRNTRIFCKLGPIIYAPAAC